MTDAEILKGLLTHWEGLRLEAYQDVAGVWTIGYGHTRTTRQGMRITPEQAVRLLEEDARPALAWARQWDLTAGQTAALASWVYNVGTAAADRSTLRRHLDAGRLDRVPTELRRWNKARVNGRLRTVRGLTRRREAEAEIFAADLPQDEGPEETGARASADDWLRWIGAGAALAITVWNALKGNGHHPPR